MRPADVLVVGAGVAGLAAAAEIGRRRSVQVIDRLPAVGGVLGYRDRAVRRLQREAENAGASFLLGTTALRWVDNRLLVAGPDGIGWLPARHLAFCGGTRPSTAGELGIGGDRPAGIFSATVAVHLMEAGVRLGNHVVVVGGSDWAARATQHLERHGAQISLVLPESPSPLGGGWGSGSQDRLWPGWRLYEVHGAARVTDVLLARDGLRQRITCEAVVLGARIKPLRNVDGAVCEGRDVTYVQRVVEVGTASQVEEDARAAAVQMLTHMGGRS